MISAVKELRVQVVVCQHGAQFVRGPATEPYGRLAVFVDIAGSRWDLLGP